jgi:hypothetical protein
MPWTIDGPSSEELGYVRRRKQGGGRGVTPQAAARPGRRVIASGVILVLLGLVGFYAAAFWVQVDRNALVRDIAGTWVQSGSPGSTLIIGTRPHGATVKGGLSFAGSVDDRSVRGAVVVPSFPSLSTTVHVTFFGQRWSCRLQSSRRMLTLTNSSGRVISFWGAS